MRQQGQRISEAGSSNAEVADSGVDCRGAAKDCIGAAEEHWTDLRTGLRQRLASCLGQALSRVPSYGSSDGEGENGSSSGSESGHGRGRPLRILSIDGGGIKGVVPALIMEEIERLCAPYHVYELFDLVCGTSTGGILALGTCVARVPVKEMRLVYEKQAKVRARPGDQAQRDAAPNCQMRKNRHHARQMMRFAYVKSSTFHSVIS